MLNHLLRDKQKLLEIFLYLFFGALVTVINILCFVLLTEKIRFPYMLSNLIAWIVAVAVAFVTNKIWVFRSPSWKIEIWFKECIQFVIARLATCIFDMGYMFVAVSLFDWNKTISKIIANFFVIIANYVLSKFIIFKKSREQ